MSEKKTLDKLANDIQERLIDLMLERCYPDHTEIQDWLTDAEAIGAEEQWKRDSEGVEPVGYFNVCNIKSAIAEGGEGSYGIMLSTKPLQETHLHQALLDPLYARPANAITLELADALQEMVSRATGPCNTREIAEALDRARAALAKAKGEGA